jgi:hypothetical protein
MGSSGRSILAGADSGWIALPLNSGWANGGPPPRYRKIAGIVYIEGIVSNTTGADNSTPVATLPAGFRPEATQITTSYRQAQVGASGDVLPFGAVPASDAVGVYMSFPAA